MDEAIDKELSINDSKMLQGLSVIAMLWLHLFDRYDYQGLYTPLVFIKGVPLSFYFGQLSDFCVMGFAFCSGYAHMKLFMQERKYYINRLKSLLRLLIQYWIIIVFFSLLSILMGQGSSMPGDFRTVCRNVFLYDISYNGAWWYMYVYVVLVLLSPLFLRISRKLVLSLAIGFVIYCGAYYLRFNYHTNDIILSKFGPFGMTLFEYFVGCAFYNGKWFSKLYKIWGALKPGVRIIMSVFLLAILLYFRTVILPSLFFAPFSGIVMILLFHFWEKPIIVQKGFLFVGKHSTNIWLIHMFFYLYLFKGFVYSVEYPILIFIYMLAICIMLSNILQMIQRPAVKWIV